MGTFTTIDVLLQLEILATVPLKATVVVSGENPKPSPEIVTGVDSGPEVGDKLLIVGGLTVKLCALPVTAA
jgi:hypothetical protein